MNPIVAKLDKLFRAAVDIPADAEVVRQSDRPDLSDFQSNIALSLAKQRRQNPMDVANEIIGKIKDDSISVRIVPPGFINIRLSAKFVEGKINEVIKKPNLGLEKPAKPLKIVVDYGGPNVAKALHVGHLRPAIIGEAMKGLARFMGHDVVGDVHLGDWGLPMGMLIAVIKEGDIDPARLSVDELNKLYPAASARAKTDKAFAETAAAETKKLQDGDAENREIWRKFVAVSVADTKKAYKMLNVEFDLWLGESDANDSVNLLADEFRREKYTRMSEGAEIIDLENYPFNNAPPPPFMVRKSNGAVMYGMTDIGTIYDRVKSQNPNLVFYHTDARQSLHFHQVFSVAELTGIAPNVRFEHLWHGNILGENRQPLKTRAGDSLPLMALIDDAIARAAERSNNKKTAADIAIAAIKFADFINPRQNDYILNLAKLTALEGKTGPYVLYTAVRIKSLLKKASAPTNARIVLKNDYDKALAAHLCGFADAMQKSFDSRALNIITQYVYDLCVRFNAFYHNCQILVEPNDKQKNSWLALSAAALGCIESWAKITKINIPEEM